MVDSNILLYLETYVARTISAKNMLFGVSFHFDACMVMFVLVKLVLMECYIVLSI